MADQTFDTFDELFDDSGVQYKQVELTPEKFVWIKSLDAGDVLDWNEFAEANKGTTKEREITLLLISKSLVKVVFEDGKIVSAELMADTKDMARIRKLKFAVFNKLSTAIMEFNGLTVKTGDEIKKDSSDPSTVH